MSQALDRLRSALAANDTDAAVDAGHGLDLILAASGAKAAAAYSELLAILLRTGTKGASAIEVAEHLLSSPLESTMEPTRQTEEEIDKNAVLRLLEEHRAGTLDHSRRIWALLVFMLWHGIFIEKRIYRDIEEATSWDAVIGAIWKGLKPYLKLLVCDASVYAAQWRQPNAGLPFALSRRQAPRSGAPARPRRRIRPRALQAGSGLRPGAALRRSGARER